MERMSFPVLTDYDCKLPCYAIGIGCEYKQEYLSRENGLQCYFWLQTRLGEGEIVLHDQRYKLSQNKGLLLVPDDPHAYYPITDNWEVDWIMFGGEKIKDILQEFDMDQSGVYEISNMAVFLHKIEMIQEIVCGQSSFSSLDSSIAVYGFLINLIKRIKTTKQGTKSNIKFNEIYSYLEENYSRLITLEELADMVKISPQYFCKQFKENSGYRVFEYINRVRIRKSKEIIFKNRDMKIAEIATLCGFDDTSYFCSVFKKIEGCTPGDFKKTMAS